MSNWHGSLELFYTNPQGQTQLTKCLQTAPLKVQRPFYPEGKAVCCHTVILHTAGGIVGGDRLTQTITLADNARALITTAAAGKVYRSKGTHATCDIAIKLEPGAVLEWLPQETIAFNGARYNQDLRVELGEGAIFCGWEITRFGRTARGERFLQGEWYSNTEIWQEGIPLWIDRQWLPGGSDIIDSPHGLGGQPIVATFVWIGTTVPQDIIHKGRNLWQGKKGSAGITQTQREGLLCRYRGSNTTEVKNWFCSVWTLLRQFALQQGAIKPRVWL